MRQREMAFDKGGTINGNANSGSSVSEMNYFLKVKNVSMQPITGMEISLLLRNKVWEYESMGVWEYGSANMTDCRSLHFR